MAGLSVEFIGGEEIRHYLEKLSGFELLQLAQIAGEELIKVSQEAFEDKKDPVTGERWPVSGSTGSNRDSAGRYIKGRSRQDTLYLSGDLFRSLAYDAGGRDNLVEVGSHMAYARIHNEGGQAGRGRKVTIPQRRFIGAPRDFKQTLFALPQVKKLIGVA